MKYTLIVRKIEENEISPHCIVAHDEGEESLSSHLNTLAENIKNIPSVPSNNFFFIEYTYVFFGTIYNEFIRF